MSRIDRFLVSPDWLQTWPNCSQIALGRSFSDHCPILLRCSAHNWGPKPFKVLDCWLDNSRLPQFVKENWENQFVGGKKIFVLKEKLKLMKNRLREWNKDVFGNLIEKRKDLLSQLNETDSLIEEEGPSEFLSAQRKEVTFLLWDVSKLQESLCRQKSRVKWIKDIDANTKFFHSCINWRRKIN